MKLLKEQNNEFVRIIIGKARYRGKGIEKPIKVISLVDTSVHEVYEKIKEMIKKC